MTRIGVDEITLEIGTPNGLFKGIFRKTTTVSKVIQVVVRDRGLQTGDLFELYYKGEALKPIKNSLAEFELAGVVQLELVATGSGV